MTYLYVAEETQVDRYVWTAGQLTPLQSLLDANWTYQENNQVMDSKKGVITKALKIDHRRTNVDTMACATYNEIIIIDAANP